MKVTEFLRVQPAPRAVFDRLATHASRPRFFVPSKGAERGWSVVTWGEFAQMIRAVALWISTAGLGDGARGVVFGSNSVAWAAASLGLQSAGGVMVPLYPASTAEQARHVLSHSDAKIVFVGGPEQLTRTLACWPDCPALERVVLLDDSLDVHRAVDALSADVIANLGGEALFDRVVSWSTIVREGSALDAREPKVFEALLDSIDLESPALMLYTSGTTGAPKGVPLSHCNIGSNGRDWLECLGDAIEADSVDALWLPFSHIFGFGELCLGNTLGFTSYLVDPATVLSRLPEISPTVFMSVPAYWQKLAQAIVAEPDRTARKAKLAALTGGRLSFCLSGGAGLDQGVKELFLDCGLLIIEGYGLTEASPTLTMNLPGSYRFDSVGKAFPSVELRLADDGEVLARGPGIFRGYHKDPEATANAFTDDGWLKTGDVGRFTDDGFLQIVDRKKDILVTAAGKNVPPVNIESRFRDDPLIAHVVVYGDGKKFLTAGVWLDRAQADRVRARGEDPSKRVAERVAEVNAQLASYETIKKYFVSEEPLTVEDAMLTASMKLRRKAVYQRFKCDFEGLYTPGDRP